LPATSPFSLLHSRKGLRNSTVQGRLASNDKGSAPALAESELRNLARLRLDLQAECVQVARHQYVAVRNIECERGHADQAAQSERGDAVAGKRPDHRARAARHCALVCGENLVGVLRGGVHDHSLFGFLRQPGGGENAKTHRVGVLAERGGLQRQYYRDVRLRGRGAGVPGFLCGGRAGG
jgi:hypothetical protein